MSDTPRFGTIRASTVRIQAPLPTVDDAHIHLDAIIQKAESVASHARHLKAGRTIGPGLPEPAASSILSAVCDALGLVRKADERLADAAQLARSARKRPADG